MRIGVDATFIGTRKPTGLAVYTWNIVNELVRLHGDIVVWTSDDYGFDISPEKIRPVMQRLSFLGEKRYMARPLWMEFVLPKLILRENVDLVFSTVPGGISVSPVPHVITVHDLTPLAYPVDHPLTVQWNFRRRLPFILKNSARVVAVSEYTKQDIVKYFGICPSHVEVIGEGYDSVNFRPVESPTTLARYGLRKGQYIATVGSATQRKNHQSLIAALGLIREKVPHKLVLVGPVSRAQERRLRRIAREHGVEERMVFPGYIPYQDLPVLYSGSATFVYISLYEGFGLPVLEAMACGAPVLASNTTSIPEVAGDAAFLVDPVDHVAVSEVLLKVLSDHSVRERLVTSGFEQASRFSWRNSAEALLTCLHKSLKCGGR